MADDPQKPAADEDQGQRPEPEAPPAAEPDKIHNPEAYWKAHYEAEARTKQKDMAAKLAAYEQAEADRKRVEQEQQGKFQDIINELEPQAKRAKELEDVVAANLERELKSIPEQFHDLLPAADVAAQLKWLLDAKERGLFNAPKAPDTDAGKQGDAVRQLKLTPEQRQMARNLGMTDEEYGKNIRVP